MKQLKFAGLLLVATFALNAIATSPALAVERCARAAPPEVGAYLDPNCGVLGGGKLFLKVKTGGVNLGNGIECAEVGVGEVGAWEDSKCTKAKAGGKFIKVYRNGGWFVAGTELLTSKFAPL